MSEHKGKIHEGGTVAPDGTHYPTVLIEVEADDADEGMVVALGDCAAMPGRLAQLGLEPVEYGVRLWGCMQCGIKGIYIAPVPALTKETCACPYDGAGSMIPISEIFTPAGE